MVCTLLSTSTWNTFESMDHERNVASVDCRAMKQYVPRSTGIIFYLDCVPHIYGYVPSFCVLCYG